MWLDRLAQILHASNPHNMHDPAVKIRNAVRTLIIASLWSITITLGCWLFNVPLPSNPLLAGLMLYAIFYIGHFVFWAVVEVLHNYSQTRTEVIGMVDALGVATGKVASIPATSLAEMARRKRMAVENFNAQAEGRTPPHPALATPPPQAALPTPKEQPLPPPAANKMGLRVSQPHDTLRNAYVLLDFPANQRLGDSIEAHDLAFAKAAEKLRAPANPLVTPSMIQAAWLIVCADNRWPPTVLDHAPTVQLVTERLRAQLVPVRTT